MTQNSSNHPLKLKVTVGMSGNCGKGLKKASQLFSNYLSDILVDKLGFEKCSLAPTAFYHREMDLRTAIHVDDPLTIGEVDTVMRFYDSLKQWLLVRVQDVVCWVDEK